ncbi:MAG: MBL fold metallo-hydrolase [Moraxellaceae bacterium]|nr:MBL fold metallo-hydrolase [Moraxellaceae bacterium]
MSVRVHHLNCGTMCPVCARLVNGRGGWLEAAQMVCHVLLIETPKDGLVLVDTGIGMTDINRPSGLGKPFLALTRPRLDPHEAAIAHVERLGFRADDVRHIIVTHLDLDHAGGLPDFPKAQVHVFAAEHAAAMKPDWRSNARYLPQHWAHSPRWTLHDSNGGERWFGFDNLHPIPGLSEDILMVPLIGHTRGHCGIAVRTDNGWILHCGDAYFFHGQMDPAHPHHTPAMALFEKIVQTDKAARLQNLGRLLDLSRQHGGEVKLFCAHDPVELARFA